MGSARIKELQIQGFRRLALVKLPIRPLTVMLGANGAGKTSILDAISPLSASASGNLNTALAAQGGLADILARGRETVLSLHVTVEDPEPGRLDDSLELETLRFGYLIRREGLSRRKTPIFEVTEESSLFEEGRSLESNS